MQFALLLVAYFESVDDFGVTTVTILPMIEKNY